MASPRNDFERNFILEQVRMSMRLNQTARLFLTSHSDCANYGGLEAFGGDRKREAEHHQHELQRGRIGKGKFSITCREVLLCRV